MARNGRGNKKQGGFAALKREDPNRLREIAAEGGRAAHESGNAHEFTPEEARDAGRKGGESSGRQGNKGGNSRGGGR